MKATLRADDRTVEMKPFVEDYLANVCQAILRSLKGTEGAQKAAFKIRGKDMEIRINDQPLNLLMDKGFAKVVTRDTLLGVLAHFRGLQGWKEIRVELLL